MRTSRKDINRNNMQHESNEMKKPKEQQHQFENVEQTPDIIAAMLNSFNDELLKKEKYIKQCIGSNSAVDDHQTECDFFITWFNKLEEIHQLLIHAIKNGHDMSSARNLCEPAQYVINRTLRELIYCVAKYPFGVDILENDDWKLPQAHEMVDAMYTLVFKPFFDNLKNFEQHLTSDTIKQITDIENVANGNNS